MARDSSDVINGEGRNQIVGNAGLYYICYELSKRGWNVLTTSRNAKGVDIIIYDQQGKETHTIQVKGQGLRKKNAIPFGTNLNTLIAEYVFIVTNILNEPSIFIMDSEKVKSLIKERRGKNGKNSYWLEVKDYENSKDNWEILKRPEDNNK